MHRTLLFSCALLAGCNCSETPGDLDGGADASLDAGREADAGTVGRCGDGIVEGDEECDDRNREPGDGCTADCQYECGDGVVGADELCDPAIADGETGACPTACDDGDPCTTDALDGTGCNAECSFGPITAATDDDDCCPEGADATTDNDCMSDCGNMVVEDGEVCDTAIAAGSIGACPTACDDGDPCTRDALAMGGTCNADCTETAITAPADDDGCCPSGATMLNDNDCAVCGDMVRSGGETCDIAILGGPGSCPSACDDASACTDDALVNGGTCQARCTFTPHPAGTADSCCPMGATLRTDPDCPPACGDLVVTAPETCDDGNTTNGDGCSDSCRVQAVGFRFSDLDLMDPHVFANVFGCIDVTNFMLGTINGVNPQLEENIQYDGDGDGDLDLSILQAFNPLAQAAGTTSPSYLAFPACTDPISSTTCTLAAGAMRTMATAMSSAPPTVCLGEVPGTARSTVPLYDPPIDYPTAPAGGACYVANAGTVMIDLGGIPITLQDAQIGGEWFGNPATEIRSGLLRGFISEADADATIIPDGTTGMSSIDNQPLSSLLRGGTNNCREPAPAVGDTDMYTPPGGGAPVRGWYFYLNFRAARVPYTEL